MRFMTLFFYLKFSSHSRSKVLRIQESASTLWATSSEKLDFIHAVTTERRPTGVSSFSWGTIATLSTTLTQHIVCKCLATRLKLAHVTTSKVHSISTTNWIHNKWKLAQMRKIVSKQTRPTAKFSLKRVTKTKPSKNGLGANCLKTI